MFFPVRDRSRARNPYRRFRMKWVMWYVSRGPFLTCDASRAGWSDIFGARLSADGWLASAGKKPFEAMNGDDLAEVVGRRATGARNVESGLSEAKWVAWISYFILPS